MPMLQTRQFEGGRGFFIALEPGIGVGDEGRFEELGWEVFGRVGSSGSCATR